MKNVKSIANEIQKVETELNQAKYDEEITIQEIENTIATLTIETNFKQQGITNADGRDAFFKSKTIEERMKLTEIRNHRRTLQSKRDFLVRIFNVLTKEGEKV